MNKTLRRSLLGVGALSLAAATYFGILREDVILEDNNGAVVEFLDNTPQTNTLSNMPGQKVTLLVDHTKISETEDLESVVEHLYTGIVKNNGQIVSGAKIWVEDTQNPHKVYDSDVTDNNGNFELDVPFENLNNLYAVGNGARGRLFNVLPGEYVVPISWIPSLELIVIDSDGRMVPFDATLRSINPRGILLTDSQEYGNSALFTGLLDGTYRVNVESEVPTTDPSYHLKVRAEDNFEINRDSIICKIQLPPYVNGLINTLNIDDGTVIPGVNLVLYDNGSVRIFETDQHGEVLFPISPGTYRVTAVKDNDIDGNEWIIANSHLRFDNVEFDVITRDGLRIDVEYIYMEKSLNAEGYVYDENGKGISGVNVLLSGNNLVATTDNSGHYNASGLSANHTYKNDLLFLRDGYQPNALENIVVSNKSNTFLESVYMDGINNISGVVYSEDGKTFLNGARVTLTRIISDGNGDYGMWELFSRQGKPSMVTGEDGTYQLPLSNGTWMLGVTANNLPVHQFKVYGIGEDVNQDIVLNTGYNIEGILMFDNGVIIPEGVVGVNNDSRFFRDGEEFSRKTLTKDDGTFILKGIGNGDFNFFAYVQGVGLDKSITVPTTQKVWEIPLGNSVYFSVMQGSGAPIENIHVDYLGRRGENNYTANTDLTSNNGYFLLSPPGDGNITGMTISAIGYDSLVDNEEPFGGNYYLNPNRN